MIFENDVVTKLLIEWQSTHDPQLMEDILKQSTSLVEVIVSIFDPIDREDLIQESYARVQHACEHFDASSGSTLHNYFTTVIRNICTTYSQRQDRLYLYQDDIRPDYEDDSGGDYEDVLIHIDTPEPDSNILENLIIHNRHRFPSIPAAALDEASEMIYYELQDYDSIPRAIPLILESKCSIPRSLATVIYQSSIIYLRVHNLKAAKLQDLDELPEFNLLCDMRGVIGDKAFKRLLLTFSGMNIRIP